MSSNSILWVSCSEKASYVPNVDSRRDLATLKKYHHHLLTHSHPHCSMVSE